MVTIECDGDDETATAVRAYGHFRCEWDDDENLAATLGLDPESPADMDTLRMAMLDLGAPSRRDFDITVRRTPGGHQTPRHILTTLLRRVDRQEDLLLREDEEAWKRLERWAKERAA